MKNLVSIIIQLALTAFILNANAQNYFPANGNVGIGTNSPIVDLEVKTTSNSLGALRLSSTKSGVNLVTGLALSDCDGCWGIARQSSTLHNQNNLNFTLNAGGVYNSTRANLIITSGYGNIATYMIIQGYNGNVGIGTTCIPADGKLTVNGKIYSSALQIKIPNASGCFPDYVFSSTYKLTSLSDLKTYININKRLPGMPSAKEVETDGIDIAELNIKMVEKIEELTLHLIQMEEKIKSLESQLQR